MGPILGVRAAISNLSDAGDISCRRQNPASGFLADARTTRLNVIWPR